MHKAVLTMFVIVAFAAPGQAQSSTAAPAAKVDRASAYYYYTLAHMYAEMASEYGNRGDYVNKAIENYKAAIKADPNTPMLSEELSEIYIVTNRLKEAESDADEALRKNPDDLNALRLLARIYFRQIGDRQRNTIDQAMLRKTVEELQKITRLDPKDVDSWLMLGQLQKAMQNSVDAQIAYKKALEIEPDNEDALTGLAMVDADLGDNAGAAALLQKLAEKNPSARSLRALAGAYEQMHEYSLAADALKRVLEMSPPDASDVKRELANYQTLAEQYPAALETYQDLVKEEPDDADSYLRMSEIYVRLKDYTKAREASAKAREIAPDDIRVRYSLVGILEAEGKTPEAIQLLKDILDSSAKRTYSQDDKRVRVGLLKQLARMYSSAAQTDPAVDALRQIATLDPDEATDISAIIVDTYEEGKDFGKAEQEADAAVKQWPNDRSVLVKRATLLAEMGKVDTAAADVKKLLDGGKGDRETYLSLAEIYGKGKRWDDMGKALDAAEKLSQDKEEREQVWFMRGAMFERMKKVDAAEKEFSKILEGSPMDALTLNYLGYMLADRNMRLQEALQYITKALDLQPNNGAFLDSLGWVYYKLGRLDEAEENMRKAVALTPRDPTVHDHFADVLMRESKVRDAIAQWQVSLKEWETSSPAELDPAEMAKVKSKLENAKVRLAKEGSPSANKQ
jgi:tetratricopeptide (TPR) repeat protein